MNFTPAELAELMTRPVTRAGYDLTQDQFERRLTIAMKMNYSLIADPNAIDFAPMAYTRCPIWGFYRNTDRGGALRVFGAFEGADGIVYMHTVAARPGSFSYRLGGTPIDEIAPYRVDRWSPMTLLRLNEITPAPGIFTDPLGFLLEGRCF